MEFNAQRIFNVQMPVKYLQGDRALEIRRCRRKDNTAYFKALILEI